jgi:protein TonB
MQKRGPSPFWKTLHVIGVVVGSLTLTAAFFLVLPVVQAIAQGAAPDTILTEADTAVLPQPDTVEEPEPEPEPEEEPPPPELEQDLPPLDLSQLELALTPGSGDGWAGALSFNLDLTSFGGQGGGSSFGLEDLDQKPRAIYQASPILDAKLRKRAPGRVDVVFEVDERGRVKGPKVWTSSDPIFERSALTAVSQWKFEPGKRNGKPVTFRMRVTITFPANR